MNKVERERGIIKVLLKNGFKIIKNSILIFICIVMAILAFHGMKVKKDINFIPSVFGYTYLNVLSGSMSPEFEINDVVIGEKISDTSTLKIGDIITYKDSNMLVTHRIVEIIDEGSYFKTKGDVNKIADGRLVPKENVISIVKTVIPKAGYLVAKFQDFTFLAFVWIILTYYIISELIVEMKKRKQKQQEDLAINKIHS